MGKRKDERSKIEFGDFQTPAGLAVDVCRFLASKGISPRSIVEPTCGVGNFLFAALDAFPFAEKVWGAEVNGEYVNVAREMALKRGDRNRPKIEQLNYFSTDWPALIANLPEPILFVGNPPWVTSSDLGYLKSHNIPEKTNFHGRSGLEAITGKSNFDISEWMLTKLLSYLDGRRATVAMLCKTAVARKSLAFGWDSGFRINAASIRRIDSARHFNASVDACLFVCELGDGPPKQACAVFENITATLPRSYLGYRDGVLVADTALYDRHIALIGASQYKWRSGVKHDCAAVMELHPIATGYENGDGDSIDLEECYLYPMMKSSDVARVGASEPKRWMIVTQKYVGEDTTPIRDTAGKTWAYLTHHQVRLEKRASSIYKGKPPFSIFGVGIYTFAPWKVAISGLYKKLEFRVIGPHAGKPVILDDTCYFVACQTEAEAQLLAHLLASPLAREFFSAFVFWDAKRPVTADLLCRLDLRLLAKELGMERDYETLCSHAYEPNPHPKALKTASKRQESLTL